MQAQGPNKCCMTSLAVTSGLAAAAELLTSLSTFQLDPQADKPRSRLQLSEHAPVDARCLHLERDDQSDGSDPSWLGFGKLQ